MDSIPPHPLFISSISYFLAWGNLFSTASNYFSSLESLSPCVFWSLLLHKFCIPSLFPFKYSVHFLCFSSYYIEATPFQPFCMPCLKLYPCIVGIVSLNEIMTFLSYSAALLYIFMPSTGVLKGHNLMNQHLPSFSCLKIITSMVSFNYFNIY